MSTKLFFCIEITFSIIFVVLICSSFQITNSNRVVIIGGKLFGQKNASVKSSWEQRKVPKSFYETGWISQPVDHKNPEQYPQWSQKYFMNFTTFYGGPGPILIFVGGESAGDPRYLAYGEMAEQVVEFQGTAMFFLEHRFYGSSFPLGDASVASLKYLTMFQALDDLAKFITHVKSSYNLENNKVILYGGSYSGSLVAYFLQFYPHLASAGLASSAPIRYHFEFKEYLERTASAIEATNSTCLSILGGGFRRMSQIIHQSSYRCSYQNTVDCFVDLGPFPLCEPLNAYKPRDITQLKNYITQFFIYLAQYNTTLPTTFNLKALCDAVLDYEKETGDDFKVFSKIMRDAAVGLYNWDCVDFRVDGLCYYMSQTGIEDDAVRTGGRQWMWQTCSDFGSYASTSGLKHPFGQKSVPVGHFVFMCQCIFGKLFTEPYIRNQVDRHTINFGSLKGTRRPFVVYTNGERDPVAGLGYLENHPTTHFKEENAVFVIRGGSHCDDLTDYDPICDSESLRQVRNNTVEMLKRWIK